MIINGSIFGICGCKTTELHIDTTKMGIPSSNRPKIVFDPFFGLFPCEIRERFPCPERIFLSQRSCLVVIGNVLLESLQLDGSLRLLNEANENRLVVRAGHMVIRNEGHAVRSVWGRSEVSEGIALRGYYFHKVADEVVMAKKGRSEIVGETFYTGSNVITTLDTMVVHGRDATHGSRSNKFR